MIVWAGRQAQNGLRNVADSRVIRKRRTFSNFGDGSCFLAAPIIYRENGAVVMGLSVLRLCDRGKKFFLYCLRDSR